MDPRLREIVYPDSDGEPMSDNAANAQRMIDTRTALIDAMRRRGVAAYVWGDQFVYPVEGEPSIRNSPDLFVVPGLEHVLRPTVKYWEVEPAKVLFAGEFLSIIKRQTLDNQTKSIEFYRRRLGTQELFLYQPLGEGMYDGFVFRFLRLRQRGPDRVIEPDPDGWYRSRVLGLDLRPAAERIEFRNPRTGEEYLPDSVRAEQEAARAARSEEACRALEERVAQLEAELRRARRDQG